MKKKRFISYAFNFRRVIFPLKIRLRCQYEIEFYFSSIYVDFCGNFPMILYYATPISVWFHSMWWGEVIAVYHYQLSKTTR